MSNSTMITFKQLEALLWVVELGGFEAAANKLNMSQSAISKRIQELEDTFDVAIFDRSKRTARLTEKGQELLDHARELIDRRDFMLERVSAREVLVRHLRLGVTELTAFTWLPKLVDMIRKTYPKVQIEPSVESSAELFRKLEEDQLDLIVVPDVFNDTRFISVPLHSVENAWMCSPSLSNISETIDLSELANFPVHVQSNSSGTGLVYDRWFAEHRIQLPKTVVSQNLLVQIGLTLSGVGVSYLPRVCLQHLIDQGTLHILKTRPGLPRIRYAVLYRADRQLGINQHIAQLAEQACDFSKLLLLEK
ncbi:LysR family transcriptional regulator [Pokkaliibacter plantistimulans]|nr:LysR family transcriptional regulator [Pokkaliibacter plantistimulans]